MDPDISETSTMEDVENSFTQDGRVNAEKYGNVMNAQYYYIVKYYDSRMMIYILEV